MLSYKVFSDDNETAVCSQCDPSYWIYCPPDFGECRPEGACSPDVNNCGPDYNENCIPECHPEE